MFSIPSLTVAVASNLSGQMSTCDQTPWKLITVTRRKAILRQFAVDIWVCVHATAGPSYPTHEANMAEPTYEELKAKLAQLEKEAETKKRSGDLIFKVGEKGGVSVYGLGRFPVTLYYEQWNRLLGAAEDIKKFMEENKSRLKLKE
jgi:hypothetical protein